jgi:hypothetical protein
MNCWTHHFLCGLCIESKSVHCHKNAVDPKAGHTTFCTLLYPKLLIWIYLSTLPMRDLCIQKFKWETGYILFKINTLLHYKAEVYHTLTVKQLVILLIHSCFLVCTPVALNFFTACWDCFRVTHGNSADTAWPEQLDDDTKESYSSNTKFFKQYFVNRLIIIQKIHAHHSNCYKIIFYIYDTVIVVYKH